MNADHLILRAKRKRKSSTKPRQTDNKRAVSDIYYAMFHTLCKICADSLIGVTKSSSREWIACYKSIEHGDARKKLKSLTNSHPNFAGRKFCLLFSECQDKRHLADYDPSPLKDGREQILLLAEQAKIAIRSVKNLSKDDSRMLAAQILFRVDRTN